MSPTTQSKTLTMMDEKPPPREVAAKLLPLYSYWMNESPPQDLKKFYTVNGHLKLLKSLQIEIVSDINRCFSLWQQFSQPQNLFDTWEFRYAFWKAYQYKLHFILLKTQKENVALLPLWYEPDEKRYTWFGSVWQEENNFFVKNPVLVPLILNICPSPLFLNAISIESYNKINNFMDLKPDDPKYVLDLKKYTDVDSFLGNLKKKRRYNLRRDKRIIESQNPRILIDNFVDYTTLIELCIKRFAEKGEDTDWDDPRRIAAFKQVIELGKMGKSYAVRMITVIIKNRVAAVDLIATYNGCYYPLKCGYDVRRFPGIGNFMNLYEIDDALKLAMNKMDFLEVDYGWKNKWFDKVPLFKFEKDYDSSNSD